MLSLRVDKSIVCMVRVAMQSLSHNCEPQNSMTTTTDREPVLYTRMCANGLRQLISPPSHNPKTHYKLRANQPNQTNMMIKLTTAVFFSLLLALPTAKASESQLRSRTTQDNDQEHRSMTIWHRLFYTAFYIEPSSTYFSNFDLTPCTRDGGDCPEHPVLHMKLDGSGDLVAKYAEEIGCIFRPMMPMVDSYSYQDMGYYIQNKHDDTLCLALTQDWSIGTAEVTMLPCPTFTTTKSFGGGGTSVTSTNFGMYVSYTWRDHTSGTGDDRVSTVRNTLDEDLDLGIRILPKVVY